MSIIALVALYACAQKQKEPANNQKKKISKTDSVKLRGYLEKLGEAPLYSVKRQRYLDSALYIVPKVAYLWQQKAMPLFKQRKYEIGMPYLDSAVKYDKEKHWLEYRAFIKCIFQKSYRAAIKDFNLAQKQNGNSYVMDHSYEFYKGLCYLQLNQFDSANYLMSKVIAEEQKTRNDVHHLHWFYMGIIQFERDDIPTAINSFDNALKIYPQFVDVLFYKAECLFVEKKKEQAIELLKKAKEYQQAGYGINEDNALYEMYPYQISKSFLDATLDYYQELQNK